MLKCLHLIKKPKNKWNTLSKQLTSHVLNLEVIVRKYRLVSGFLNIFLYSQVSRERKIWNLWAKKFSQVLPVDSFDSINELIVHIRQLLCLAADASARHHIFARFSFHFHIIFLINNNYDLYKLDLINIFNDFAHSIKAII